MCASSADAAVLHGKNMGVGFEKEIKNSFRRIFAGGVDYKHLSSINIQWAWCPTSRHWANK